MKGRNRELHSVVKGLKALLKRTERIEREIGKTALAIRRKGVAKAPPRATTSRGGRDTAMAAVYSSIKRRKRGATTTQIRDKTGFDNKKIWNAINRLKTQKKIKNARRGVYVVM